MPSLSPDLRLTAPHLSNALLRLDLAVYYNLSYVLIRDITRDIFSTFFAPNSTGSGEFGCTIVFGSTAIP